MTTVSREEARERLESYLRRRLLDRDKDAEAAAALRFTPDLDLIDSRLVDSLGFMGFLLAIEELAQQPIDMTTVHTDDFRSLERISARFLSHLPSGGTGHARTFGGANV